MTKGLKALYALCGCIALNVKNFEDITMTLFDTGTQYKISEAKEDVEKELKKPQTLYNLIKEKRDNACLERDAHAIKQDISNEEKTELYAEICTYNDILSLIESMFEGDLKHE